MSAVLAQSGELFRPMREADLDQVLAVENEAHAFPWSRGIFIDCIRIGYCCRVIETAREVRAFAIMSVGAGEAHLLNLCVRPACQKQGLGRMLLVHMLSHAAKRDARVMFLEVRPSNTGALHLYERNGFRLVGQRRNYYPAYGGREDALVLSRELGCGWEAVAGE